MMMTDTREAILEQMEALLASISGIVSVWRDRGEIPDDSKLPAIILLDGRERSAMDTRSIKTVRDAPKIVELHPQVIMIPYPRDSKTNLTVNEMPAPLGPEMSSWLYKIRSAVINDPTLITIIGGDRGTGQIIYEGSTTDMEQGGSMTGGMLIEFCIRYVLFPPQA